MKKLLIVSIGCAVVVFAVWGAYWFSNLGIIDSSERGQFGDKFGGLNTLFTGLAFVGLIATLWHQFDENQKRAGEMFEFRDRLERTASALENQTKAQEREQYFRALQARIDGYTWQIQRAKDPSDLWDQQDLLLWELADFLWEARKMAGKSPVTKEDRDRRQKEAEIFKILKTFK